MARIRSIKPEFWTSEQVMECSTNARLMFIGMWNFADDLGRLPLSPKTIKAQIFPSDDMSAETILGMIQELSRNGLVLTYTVDNRDYLQITGWQHQRIDKPQAGKCPSPVTFHSATIPGKFPPDRKGEEGNGEDRKEETREAALCEPSDFDAFWDEWPNKVGKPAALKAFKSAVKRGASLWEIQDGLRSYIRDKPPDRPWLNPATFLNQNRWEDQPAPTASAAKPLTEFQRKQQATINVTEKLKQSALAERSLGSSDWLLPDDHGERPGDLRGGPSPHFLTISGLPRQRSG